MIASRTASTSSTRGAPGVLRQGAARALGTLAMVAFGWALAGEEAAAQTQISLEPRVGVTFPTGDLSDEGAEAGLALGAEVLFNLQRNVTAYVGLQRHGFACDSGCDLGRAPRSTGFGAGIKYIFPSPADALVWARGGVLAHTLATDDSSGDRNLGFEMAAGIDMPVAPRLHLTPHIGLLSHDAGVGFTARWINFGIGFHYHLN
jgi:hypothetical protein